MINSLIISNSLKMKASRSRADGVSDCRNDVYYIAAPLVGISATL